MGELVATLRRFGELDVSDELAAALTAMSPATMDRRLAADRAAMTLCGRSHTKPGSLLKDAIAIRTWAQWDDAAPGFVEIDLVGHEGGNAIGEHAYTLTVTDIATGWTENRSVPNKARKWVIAALALAGCGAATDGLEPSPAKSSSATVAVGGEPFSLYMHCGIHELTFGGRWYERVGGALDDGQGNPPQGWDNPYQAGTLTSSGSTVLFRDHAGHREVFQLRPGATRPKVICS